MKLLGKIIAVAAGGLIGMVALGMVLPKPDPAQECYNKYGYDKSLQLTCLAITDENLRRDNWRATH